jgi:hypothetical protein
MTSTITTQQTAESADIHYYLTNEQAATLRGILLDATVYYAKRANDVAKSDDPTADVNRLLGHYSAKMAKAQATLDLLEWDHTENSTKQIHMGLLA